jgi:hypothetical protein
MRPVFGPAGDDDARTAYVFRCGETDLYAITLEETGSNLPADCKHGWQRTQAFALGVHEVVPLRVSPEPILRGILKDGFFLWRDAASNPHGTPQ